MSVRIGRSKIKVDPDAWIRILDEMIESGEYVFAKDYLTSVRTQVEDKRTITKKQMNGIQNIRRSTRL